jgi:hypothetical protein
MFDGKELLCKTLRECVYAILICSIKRVHIEYVAPTEPLAEDDIKNKVSNFH